ncbi:diguanylate cyclase [Candidatus Magnetomorum sp. HK-1]|nr:diguanylate cyclase [Candidatus Magnetomorum sp. HK-1]
MSDNSLIQQLLQNELFINISNDEKTHLNDNYFTKVHYKPGDIIIKENDISNELFLILKGIVQITRNTVAGKVSILITRKKGEVIGELGLIENKPRSSSVVSQTDVVLIKIEKDNLFEMLSLMPTLKTNINRIIASRFRQTIYQTSSEILKYQIMLELNQTIVAQKKELERLNGILERKNKELYQMAMTDQLTQINNRCFIMEVMAKTFSNNRRYQMIFSCILVDIDYFKKFNDIHGHLAGDFVLKKTAQLLKDLLRKGDYVARYGGEEFLIILPNTQIENAIIVAEKIRQTVEKAVYTYNNTTELKVTISLGLTNNLLNSPENEYQMIKNADIALYEAKKNGRNRVVAFSP